MAENMGTEVQSGKLASTNPTPNDLKKSIKLQELPNMMNHITPAGISRERSFVRTSNPQNHHQVNFLVLS